MTIAKKLKINTLIVSVLLVANVVIATLFVTRISSDTRQLVEVEEPLEEAVLEMEINAGETARSVLSYVLGHEETYLDVIIDSERDFERYYTEFEKLAETQQERTLGTQVNDDYQKFKTLGDEITSLSKQRFDGLQEHRSRVIEINQLIEQDLRQSINESSSGAYAKTVDALEMEINIDESFAGIESYVIQPEQDLKQAISDSLLEFQRYSSQYQARSLSTSEKDVISRIDSTFEEAVVSSNEIIEITDSLNLKLQEFQALLVHIDQILDDQIQPLIQQETLIAEEDSNRSGIIAITFVLISGVVVFAFVFGVGRVVSKGITESANRLGEGAEQYGLGNFNYRIKMETEDELGALATTFNEMADKRELAEQRFQTVFEATPTALLLINAEGRIVMVNQGAEIAFGYERDELIGQLVEMLLPDQAKESHPSLRASYYEDPQPRAMGVGRDLYGHHKSNGEFPIEVALSPVEIEGEHMVLSALFDITMRKQIEHRLQESHDQLEDRVDRRTAELKASNAELEAFAYSVSHDLRAPLRGIDGFSLALLEDYGDKIDELGSGYLNRVRSATQRMGELIDGLLELSRISRIEIRHKKVNLSDMAINIAKDLLAADPDRSVKLIIQPDIIIKGDSRLLGVAMNNLISNAWKFTGGSEDAQIEFGSRDHEGEIHYFVRDNGVGFDPVYVDKLFGAFQRLHSSSEFPGTGIGLAIVQRVVHRHGGLVWAEGEVGVGATFYFTVGSDSRSESSEKLS